MLKLSIDIKFELISCFKYILVSSKILLVTPNKILSTYISSKLVNLLEVILLSDISVPFITPFCKFRTTGLVICDAFKVPVIVTVPPI